jgi:nucleotide-binding universal stress UspA family protein
MELKHAIEAYRGATRIRFVHRGAARLGDIDMVAGFGGQLTTVDNDADDRLLLRPRAWEARMLFEHLQIYEMIFQTAQRRLFLFATPPQAHTIDLQNGEHTGVHVLNEIMRQYRPHLVCCGGPTSGRGVETIEGVPVVNPGSLAAGEYALVDLERLTVHFERIVEPAGAAGISFHSILVALDDSPQSWRALELAAELARNSGAELTLLHAFEPVRPTLGEPYLDVATVKRTAEGERFLAQAASYIADLTPHFSVVEGPASDAILCVADARKVDLIVMGARSRGVVSAVLGSVSSRVVHQAGCPVLVARDRPISPVLVDRVRFKEHPGPAVHPN